MKFRFEFCLFIYFSFLKIPAIVMIDSIADATLKMTIATSNALSHFKWDPSVPNVEHILIDIGQDRSRIYCIHTVSLAGVWVFLRVCVCVCMSFGGSERERIHARSLTSFFVSPNFFVPCGPFMPLDIPLRQIVLFIYCFFFLSSRLLLFLSSLDHDFHLLLLFL